ncbi:hypothetical protein HQ590_15695 [bacterium]|nr:hypothetical protein [bacterium]
MDPLVAWTEWHQRCALGLCSPAAQAILREFALTRFVHFLAKYAERSRIDEHQAARLAPSNPWHLFETYLTVNPNRSGKHYKDWLFARTIGSADPALAVIQGGATLLVRDVVREYLRRECPPPWVSSIDTPVPGTESALTVADLLPAAALPTDDIEQREWEMLAAKHAGTLPGQLDHRERVALVAKELGVPLSHPVALRVAGCSKSMLHAAWRQLYHRVARQLRPRYPDDPPVAILQLAILTIAAATQIILEQVSSESGLAQLFLLVEKQPGPVRPNEKPAP